MVAYWNRPEFRPILRILRWSQNAFCNETTSVRVFILDRPGRDEAGDGFVAIKDQYLFAVLDEFDVGAEFGLQFADLCGPHTMILPEYD
jgi:hypothetical protein